MTLRELISTLVTTNAQLKVVDSAGVELVDMKASGYNSLEDEIEESEIQSWAIMSSNSSIKVILKEATTTSEI